MIDIFSVDDGLSNDDAIVHGPLHVPMIDLLKKIGIAVVNSGDVISLVFDDPKTMLKLGKQLQQKATAGANKIFLMSDEANQDDINAAKDISREFFA